MGPYQEPKLILQSSIAPRCTCRRDAHALDLDGTHQLLRRQLVCPALPNQLGAKLAPLGALPDNGLHA